MILRENIPLAPLTTFRIGGPARFFAHATSDIEVQEILTEARTRGMPMRVLGGGANVLVPDAGVDGIILQVGNNDLTFTETGNEVEVLMGAGTIWDDVVHEAISRDLFGIENLAGIPGTVGGAVVQNIGAYGVELSEVFLWADTCNARTGTIERIGKEDAAFAYRDSIFKKRSELIILRSALRLTKEGTSRLGYPDLQKAQKAGEPLATPRDVSAAVRNIRARKFPDLSHTGTAGSFFKNPVIGGEKAAQLLAQFSDIKHFPQTDGTVKLSLAWILDKALNLRGFSMGKVRLFENQPLVIVAEQGARAEEVDALAREVEKRVQEKIGITIEREVETFGARKIS